MKRLALGLLIFTFALSLNLAYAQDKKDLKIANKKYSHTDTTYKHDHKLMTPEQTVVTNPTDAIAKAEVTKGTGKPVNTVCIVSGEELDGKVLADYKGKTYSFCCKTCLKKFTKDPEKYVTKFEKESNKTKTIN